MTPEGWLLGEATESQASGVTRALVLHECVRAHTCMCDVCACTCVHWCSGVCVCVLVYMDERVGTATVYKHIWHHHYLGEQWSQTWGTNEAPQGPLAGHWGSDRIPQWYPGQTRSRP